MRKSRPSDHGTTERGRPQLMTYLSMLLMARRAKTDERGASAVEYGLLIAGIAALVVVVIFAFSDTITGLFDDTCADIAAEQGGTATTCE